MIESDVKLSVLHKTMARHMITSWTNVPQFQLETKINCKSLIKLRGSLDYKPSITTIIVKATAIVLKKYPMLNSTWRDNKIVQYEEINIGIATDTKRGLLVPIINDVSQKSLYEVYKALEEIKENSIRGNYNKEQLMDGTFTISSLGMFRINSFRAIVNSPQAAILAVSKISDVPIVEDGIVKSGKMMNLGLSIDHRVTDGAYGARFLTDLAETIEKISDIELS